MDTYRLKAISLLDGRNWDKVSVVSDYFSEYALIKYRIRIETEFLIFLSQETKLIRNFTNVEIKLLKDIYDKFSPKEAQKVKEYEKKINHDVKAVEYYLRDLLVSSSLSDVLEFIHFGLTSYDINIPSYGLMLKDFRNNVLLPKTNQLLKTLRDFIVKTKKMTMLGRTHGQPALPTTMGKEMTVFYRRIENEMNILKSLPIEGKLTGAVGNFNALQFAVPEYNWIDSSTKFIHKLGLEPNIFTTQIIPYDSWLRVFDSIKRLNNILLGLVQDIWWYISMDYILQKKKEGEVGSSTMSHKINPITFENAEGNLGFANAQFEFFVKKLAVSRLQRDLSDSTVKRDFGLAFGFTLLAWDSILTGFTRIAPNLEEMNKDLDVHWEIFAEGIQTYLRMRGYKKAFELMKDKTRGKVLTKSNIYKIIDELPISQADKKRLKIRSLSDYQGLAVKLCELALKGIRL